MEEYLIRCFESQPFSGAVIKPAHGLVEFFLSDGTEVAPFGEVLANQAVGIFVGTAFPGVVRMSEIHPGGEGVCDALVLSTFGAVVEREGMDTAPEGTQELHGRLAECLGGALRKRGEQGVAAFAFHPGDQYAPMTVTDKCVTFPVADATALIYDRGTRLDADPVFELSTSFGAPVTLAPLALTAQPAIQRAAGLLVVV